MRLYEALDAGDASYAQGKLTVIADSGLADGIVEAIQSLGITPVVKDQ